MTFSSGNGCGKTKLQLSEAQVLADNGASVYISVRVPFTDKIRFVPLMPRREVVDDVLNGIEFVEGLR